MRYLKTDDIHFVDTLRLSYQHAAVDRPEGIIVDISPYARSLHQAFNGAVQPLSDKVLYRQEGAFPVIDLETFPGRYVVYRHDIDPFDDAVKDLPVIKSVYVTDDILDLKTRRIISLRELQRLTTQPNQPIQELKLITQLVENHLHYRLPLQYVHDRRWEWTDQCLMRYLKQDVYLSSDPEIQKERLNVCYEEIRFYLTDLLERIDNAVRHHSNWMLYNVNCTLNDLRIESRGDYRVFAWMREHETESDTSP